ncbi:protein FAR1-RELATED SEQUENCE 5-like [Tripterygium wilfordii]|uniref:protein FAR1-RELATED SEQUENCE 5-like n=1 Tax=Tripterygium wilfordii TaxID=458696 RepID=UPI0018F84021|nr:protein FAR1-RELATED SEQUENCE 5-like [Tripterygium wilfordii]
MNKFEISSFLDLMGGVVLIFLTGCKVMGLENPIVANNKNDEDEIRVGMIFNKADEAYDAYNRYAINKGFGVRRGKKYHNRRNELSRCIFLCSCEGQPPYVPPHEQKEVERTEKRCGCKAHIKFKIADNVWEVTELISEHNHELIKEEQRHLIRSGRKISQTSKGVISSLANAGIGATKAYSYIANEAGGVENLGFTLRDCHNFLQSERSKMISSGDAQSLMNHFKFLQVNDSMFFYATQVDEENRLTNFFWRDGLSKMDYDSFGDVVIFDTTYRTNKYNMIYAPFVGVNHHWKNVFFGCAFLLDETTSSFVWLFETFLASMGNRAPKTIFTDQAQAMASAIRIVFPNAYHRLCTWHIAKNAATNIPHLYGKPEFKKYFSRLLHGCENDMEFETTWGKMVQEWNLADNKWLCRLYDLRLKWSPAFSRDIFSAGIRSTQRSESTNNVFQHMACKTMTLTEFVIHYQENAKKMREAEIQDDYICASGKPKMHVRNSGILTHASIVYTHTIFKMFQDEFLQAMSENIMHSDIDGSIHIYSLQSEVGRRQHLVQFNSIDNSISCGCKMFETKGWLCRHTLRVLNANPGFKNIPSQYILKRWTRGAKEGIARQVDCDMSRDGLSSSKTVRFNKLMRKAFAVMSLSATDVHTTEIADKNLDRIMDEMQAHKATMALDSKEVHANMSCLNNEPPLSDPPRKRAKGIPYGRLKGALEKRPRRASKESTNQTSYSNVAGPSSMATFDQGPSSMTTFVQESYYASQMNSNSDQQSFLNNDMTENLSFTNLLSQASCNNSFWISHS